jgi:hypothetical protein
LGLAPQLLALPAFFFAGLLSTVIITYSFNNATSLRSSGILHILLELHPRVFLYFKAMDG